MCRVVPASDSIDPEQIPELAFDGVLAEEDFALHAVQAFEEEGGFRLRMGARVTENGH